MSKPREYKVFTRRQVEGLIAEGRSIIIVDQYVLNVGSWLKFHPGGDKAVMHMVGRDATDEVTVLHSPEAQQQMMRFRIGRIEGAWKNFLPPIQGGHFRRISEEEDNDANEASSSTSGASVTSGSSGSRSREASPIFDTDDNGNNVRHRAKASSAPTPDDDKEVDYHMMTPTGFLDSETRKEINLDLEKYPALDAQTQGDIVQKYRELHERIKAEGLFDCNYGAYAVEVTRYILLFSTSMLFLRWGWYIPSAMFLGMTWHQLVFTVHDAGHMGITHDFHIDTSIAIFIADFIGGLSAGWWKRSHNVHHIVTNSLEHDPDVEYLPFMAISHRFFGDMTSSYYEQVMKYDALAKILVMIQSKTYYLLMLFGRFNLYVLSWDYLLNRRGPRKGAAAWYWYLEMAGQVFFWTWYGYGILYNCIPTNWNRFLFVLVSHMLQAPLHVQITLSHFAMSTTDMGPDESFPQKMLRTTMDVDCPTWLDFFHGGLQFQVVHHLFPRIPRHNLRRTQKLVQEFCNEVEIPYALYGFLDCNKEVLGRFDEVSRQAAILAECQKAAAKHL